MSYEDGLAQLYTGLQSFWKQRPAYAKTQLIQYLQGCIIIGDVNGNGTVGAEDAALLREWLRGNPDAALTEWYAADLNTDGRLDAYDLTLLKQMILR